MTFHGAAASALQAMTRTELSELWQQDARSVLALLDAAAKLLASKRCSRVQDTEGHTRKRKAEKVSTARLGFRHGLHGTLLLSECCKLQ